MKANFNGIEAAAATSDSSARIPVGGYIVRIISVEDNSQKESLTLTLDIADGEYANFGSNYEAATGKLSGYRKLFAGYGVSAKGYDMKPRFLRLLNMIEETMGRRKFCAETWLKKMDEQELVGMEFGVVMENTRDRNDSSKIYVNPSYFKVYSAKDIEDGKYAAPVVIEEPVTATNAFGTEIPF